MAFSNRFSLIITIFVMTLERMIFFRLIITKPISLLGASWWNTALWRSKSSLTSASTKSIRISLAFHLLFRTWSLIFSNRNVHGLTLHAIGIQWPECLYLYRKLKGSCLRDFIELLVCVRFRSRYWMGDEGTMLTLKVGWGEQCKPEYVSKIQKGK